MLWATGGVRKATTEAGQAHPELDLVGCYVHSEAKRGLDVGDILGTQQAGVTATDEVEDILASDADVVVYAPLISIAGGVASERDAELARACVDGGVTLHGMGGGVGVVTGFSGSPEQARESPTLGLLTGGFTQPVRMCPDTLGFADAPIRTSHEIAVAAAPIESPSGIVEPGQVAGQRFGRDAMVGDQLVVQIEIKGDPDTFVTIRGRQATTIAEGMKRNPGIVATANHCVNFTPHVCAAATRIKSRLNLPVVAGRAHPDLGGARG